MLIQPNQATHMTTPDTFATLPLTAITASLTNPRKTFNPAKLAELTESIKASGVHQPVLVRPLPGARVADTFDIHAAGGGLKARPVYELIAGERRYRACQMAGLDTIPALVRDLSDAQVMEVQIVENLQRDDLTALEEAEGYEALMQHSALTAEAIGGKIGKSRSYVFGRLKLLDLSVECKQAMRDGHIDASRALLIARIPDTALQTKALAEAMRKDYRGEVCSVRALQSWLQANVMLRLEAAKFNIHDSTLVIGVGNCHTCPKRTGANPDLFADVQGVDICTDPACFHDKEEAHRTSVLDTAAKRGMRLIEGEEAQTICHQYTGHLTGYSPLTQVRTDTRDGDEVALGVLLGKDTPDQVLIENPWTKELIAAVPTAEAEAMLLARGLVKTLQAKAASKDDVEANIKRLYADAAKKSTKLYRDKAFEVLADMVHGMDDELAHRLICPLLLRAWWLRQVADYGAERLAPVFGLTLLRPEVKTIAELEDAQETQVRLHIQACSQGKLFKAMALWLVREDCEFSFYGDIEPPTLFNALASEMGVDLDDIEAAATAEVRAEMADTLKALKAQLKSPGTDITATGYRGPNGETWSGRGLMPRWLAVLVEAGQDKALFKITPDAPANSPTVQAPAAQAKGGGGAKKPKTKTTAAQAQAQIAAAMQAQETNPGADAQGNAVDSSQPVATSTPPDACASTVAGVSLAVDMRVEVTKDPERLPMTQHKWCGSVGTITQQLDEGRRWMVTFRGRNGGMCAFDAADLVEVA